MKSQFVIIFSVTVLSYCLAEIVTTQKGSVKGRALLTPENRTFYAFTGIPYAKPPLDTLRFQAPVEVDSWQGVLDATKNPNRCFQVVYNFDDENEDCLYLNVYTPSLDLANSTRKLPVVFSLNGDLFRSVSSGYENDGPDWFVERDLIVVTLNYRVGPFGFLATGDKVVPGNAGLKDQQLALQWTFDNIEAFGGDKQHIVLQGQGAGAASVTYHLLNPKSGRLIKYALAESGSAICSWAWRNDSLTYAIRLATVVNNGIRPDDTDSENLLGLLQAAPARAVDAASQSLFSAMLALPTLEPEHENAFITQPMYELLEAGNFSKVPLLIGFNSEEEISLSASLLVLQGSAHRFDQRRQYLLPAAFDHVEEPTKYDTATLIQEAYIGNGTFARNFGPLIGYFSDSHYTRPVTRFAQLYAQYSPVYLYQFSYKGSMGFNRWRYHDAERVAYGEEKYYLSVVKTRTYDNTDYGRFSENDLTTHWRLLELWSNFYKYGNPTPEPQELLSNVTWPAVSKGKLLYLNINATLEVQDTPKAHRYNVWTEIFDQYASRPYVVY